MVPDTIKTTLWCQVPTHLQYYTKDALASQSFVYWVIPKSLC